MALTADRNTVARDGNQLSLGMAAGGKIFAGSLVARDAAGHAIPAANTAGIAVVGMAETQVDNTGGAAGALAITVRRNRSFHFANSAGSALTIADIGSNAMVEADDIVAKAATQSIVAGKILDVDATGVWIEVA